MADRARRAPARRIQGKTSGTAQATDQHRDPAKQSRRRHSSGFLQAGKGSHQLHRHEVDADPGRNVCHGGTGGRAGAADVSGTATQGDNHATFLPGHLPGDTAGIQGRHRLQPSHFRDNPDHPVEKVTWIEAVEFCKLLSAQSPRSRRGGSIACRRKRNGNTPAEQARRRPFTSDRRPHRRRPTSRAITPTAAAAGPNLGALH